MVQYVRKNESYFAGKGAQMQLRSQLSAWLVGSLAQVFYPLAFSRGMGRGPQTQRWRGRLHARDANASKLFSVQSLHILNDYHCKLAIAHFILPIFISKKS